MPTDLAGQHDSRTAVLNAEAAERLLSAYASGEPAEPVIERHPAADVSDAYAIQRAQVIRWIAAGDQVAGYKVGLTSRAMQLQSNVDQPDYGHLMRNMFAPEHVPVPATKFIQPRAEPEVAFVLSRPLQGPGVTIADAVRAIDCLLPALEIIDSRIRDWRITIVDTIADNASSGAVVLGGRPVSLRAIDLRLAGCVLYRNGEIAATGVGGAVLGSPLNSLAWLANTLGPLGVSLEAGHVVLTGSMTRATPIAPGDRVSASFAGLGSVSARFAPEQEETA
jgi:2-keto-4-pentenoate hydratase